LSGIDKYIQTDAFFGSDKPFLRATATPIFKEKIDQTIKKDDIVNLGGRNEPHYYKALTNF
jgi:hypothetical protein